MVNKPFWHISDFVLASYTLSCVKMSDFMVNNRHLREVLIFSFIRSWCVWGEHWAENGHNTSRDTKKWFYSMTTLGLTLPSPLKPSWKRSNGKYYPTRRISQILRGPIITCSGRWHMVWLISSSAYMKTSKNGLIRGGPQKMNTFTVTVFELYQEDGQKLWLTIGFTLNDSFVTIFSQ